MCSRNPYPIRMSLPVSKLFKIEIPRVIILWRGWNPSPPKNFLLKKSN